LLTDAQPVVELTNEIPVICPIVPDT